MIEVVQKDGIATVRIASPSNANALSPAVFAELVERIEALQAPASGASVLVLTGGGHVFSSGANLDVLGTSDPDALADAIAASLLPLRNALFEGRLPTIAAVNGAAVGGAVGLALLCDIVIATRAARFSLVFSHLGLVPDSGLTQTLPLLVGEARARALLMSGATIGADEAAAIGMIHRAVDDAAFGDEVAALASRLAKLPGAIHRTIRHAMAAGRTNTFEAQVRLEARLQAERVLSDDFRIAMQAHAQRARGSR